MSECGHVICNPEWCNDCANNRIAELERELRSIRSGHTVTVEYDLSPAMKESALRDKLIELGWTPPGEATLHELVGAVVQNAESVQRWYEVGAEPFEAMERHHQSCEFHSSTTQNKSEES